MKLYRLWSCLFILFIGLNACEAKIKNTKVETYKVYGNCNTCKKIIEKASKIAGVAKSSWNVDTKMLVLTYDSTKTSADNLLKSIAEAGYDNDKFIANQQAYSKLEQCCQYARKPIAKMEIATTEVNSTNQNDQEESDSNDHKVIVENTSTLKKDINQLLETYYALKNALVASNASLANAKAIGFLDAMSRLPQAGLSKEQLNYLVAESAKIKVNVQVIAASKDLAKQRSQLNNFSNTFFELVKFFNANSAPMMKQYCPMKDAYWISNENAIKNPYYGNEMLTCGSVKEIVK